jgi:PAS domain S-box-containing protein
MANILLVDDQPSNLLVLRAILEELGQNLVEARSGDEALRLLSEHEFAVVLLDVLMPGLDGFETAKRMRQQAKSLHTPIIFLTAHDIDRSQLEHGYSMGAVDFLVKPLLPVILKAKVSGFIDLFEEKQKAKREAEQLRLLIHRTTEYAIFMLDPEGRIITWNPGAERIKGYRAEEIIGQHFSRFYPQEAIDRGWPQHELAVAKVEGHFEDEGWRVRKDGTQFWANVVITALYDEKGGLRGFSKITRDLTTRKNAEETAKRLVQEETARRVAEENAEIIQEHREKLRVTLASIGDAVISTDAQGSVTFLNAVAERLMGWSDAEAKGKPLREVFQIVNEQTRQPAENPAKRALREGVVVGLANHTVLIAKDGTERPIEDSAAPIRDANGQTIGVVLVFRDVSKQRHAEAMNRLLADVTSAMVGPLHYQSILREVADLTVPGLGDFCLFDVLTTDERLERVGWKHVDPIKQALAEKVLNFTPPKDAMNHPVAKALQTGKAEFNPQVSDEWLEQIATSPAHLEFLRELGIHSLITVPLAVGRRRHGALTFGYGVSGRRHTTEELRLAEEVARRTALTLENAKLLNQLREADRKKDEFLAVLAHELRNPLAPLSNALQAMRLTTTDNKSEQVREMMERQVKQMVRLVDDLLDISRITSGKISLRKEKLDLSDVIVTALETSRPLIEAARHELTVVPTSSPLYVEGDRTRLAQVVSNLLTNSAKYTPPGGHIWLTLLNQGDEAAIKVQDNGIGIAADMLPQIFEMFAQVDRNESRSQGGLGIGLTLVKRLVEMHGGRIEAHSAGLGQGSEFIVRLPLESQKAASNTTDAASTDRRNAEGHAGRRILVVDDNVDSATSLAMLLERQGNIVRTAHNGHGALQAAADFVPDVVLLDIGMPGMDGFQVAQKLRYLPQTKNAVLIAQTGWGQERDRLRSTEAGFDHHLVKPVDPEALNRLLASLK